MFRFIHAADTHIDSPLVGLDAYEGAPADALRGATRRAFENLVALAVGESVDFVLIAGDLYDGDWKDFSTGLFFTRQMVRLRVAGIPVYVIAGNHDAASVLTRRLDLPDNVHFFSTRQAETLQVEGLPVAVHGRSFPNRKVPENLSLEYPSPVPGRFNIGLLHTSLSGAPGHDTYAPCTLADLTDKGYGYWALGHVHQPQVLARDPWVVFPGNLQGRHVREAGPRGCRLVSVNDSLEVVDAVHRSLDVVRWERVSVDVTGIDRQTDALERIGDVLARALDNADGRLLAVRMTLTGSTPLHGAVARNLPDWRAQCQAQAQIAGGDRIWIEELVRETGPIYDEKELAERDELTKILLEGLEEAEAAELEIPPPVREMLAVLPPDIRHEVARALSDRGAEAAAEGGGQPGAEAGRPALLAEVRALLLESLRHAGGEGGGGEA